MQHEKTDKNNGWRDVAFPYVIKTFRAGQFPTAKLLFQKLEHSAGVDDSPFEKGTGANKGSLYIPKISKSLALKTLQNAMKEIRSSPL